MSFTTGALRVPLTIKKKAATATFFFSSEYDKDRFPFWVDGFELTKKQAKYLAYARCDIIF